MYGLLLQPFIAVRLEPDDDCAALTRRIDFPTTGRDPEPFRRISANYPRVVPSPQRLVTTEVFNLI